MSSRNASNQSGIKHLIRLFPILAIIIYPLLQTYFLLFEHPTETNNETLSFFRLLFGISILLLAATSAKRFFDVFSNRSHHSNR